MYLQDSLALIFPISLMSCISCRISIQPEKIKNQENLKIVQVLKCYIGIGKL